MPVSNNDRLNIMARIHSAGPADSQSDYNGHFVKLNNHKKALDISQETNFDYNRGKLSFRDFELAVELIVVYEGLRDDLGWWKRTKRRMQLTKEYS